MDLRRLRALIKTLKASGVAEYSEDKEAIKITFAPKKPKQVEAFQSTDEAKEAAKQDPEALEDILYWSAEQ